MAVISLEEAKLYLKVDTTDDDVLITSLITVAESTVEKLTGRKLLTSDFAYVLGIPHDPILIPFCPLQEITKIETVVKIRSIDRIFLIGHHFFHKLFFI